jgi:hypothetical protein
LSYSRSQREAHLGVLYNIEQKRKVSDHARNVRRQRAALTEVLEHGLLGPSDTLVDVGGGVREALGLTGLSAKDTVEVGSDLAHGGEGLTSAYGGWEGKPALELTLLGPPASRVWH